GDRLGARDGEELIELVPRGRIAQCAGQQVALPRTTVVDVASARRGGSHQSWLGWEVGDEPLEQHPALTSEKAAQHRCRAEASGHARNPNALPASVKVDLLA